MNNTINNPTPYQQPYTQQFYNNYTNQTNQPTSGMTRSRLFDNNKYEPNRPLYDPLRNAVSYGPQVFQYRQYQNIKAIGSSKVTHEFRPISLEKYQDIRENTYMIQEPLRPTSNLQKVQGKNYYILNTDQKYGSPINEFQFRSRLAASRQKGDRTMVVYQPERPLQMNTIQTQIPQMVPEQISMQPQTIKYKQVYVPSGPTLVSKKKKKEKYNIYSCLDEPLERFKRNGCKGMTCPANQCVASRQGYDWK